MLDRPTVFVIGAGAGFDIGMPLGEQLSELIADGVNFYFEAGELTKGKMEIWKWLIHLAQRTRVETGGFLTAGRMISGGIRYTRSIDNYVRAHSDKEAVKLVAKIAIVHTIVAAERQCAISIDRNNHPPQFIDEARAHKSWLADFFSMLQDGVSEAKNLENIFDNLTIINFNYDRCIEHYMFHVMQRLYPSKGEAFVIELIKKNLKVLHPYGVVGLLPWQDGRDKIRFGGNGMDDDIARLLAGIRTYNEEIEDKSSIDALHTAVGEAKRIVFLGFHFHKQNVDLLRGKFPPRDGAIEVFGTTVDRSAADISKITMQIQQMLETRGGPTSLHIGDMLDCKSLFREYGTSFMCL